MPSGRTRALWPSPSRGNRCKRRWYPARMPVSESRAAPPSVRVMAVAAPAPRWARLIERLRVCFWLKAVGTTTFMALFFVGYFHLLRHPAQPVIEMPLAAVDHWIGFQPWAL